MSAAVGMVEVLGLPPALAAADAMCKAARVTLVGYEKLSGARYTIIVRGNISDVEVSVAAGIDAAQKISSSKEKTLLLSSHVIARLHENVEAVLPLHYRVAVEQFRQV